MTFKCVHCGIRRNYYETEENASRQNCQVSDCGYHHFAGRSWCCFLPRKKSKRDQLLEHRRRKRPWTI